MSIVSPTPDGLLRVLILRPGSTSDLADLSVMSVDASNKPSPELPLISDITTGERFVGGKVQVTRKDGSSALVDAVTGEVQDIPPTFLPYPGPPTPGGRSYTPESSTAGTLNEADGHTTAIQLVASSDRLPFGFYGEDFYYLDPQQKLIDIPPSDVPRTVATGVSWFGGSQTPDGPVLLLARATSNPAGLQGSVLDPTSGTETVLPFDPSHASVSPDGRWVLDDADIHRGNFTFFDDRAGTEQTIGIATPVVSYFWRPASSEVWMTAGFGATNDTGVWIVRPDAPTVSVPGIYLQYVDTHSVSATSRPFTDDGAHWFYTRSSDTDTQIIQVARTDDPSGPAFPLNPPSTSVVLALPLPDGNFLTSAYAKDYNRADVSVVDPRTGDTQVLARRGVVMTTGQTRVMGIFHTNEYRGDLTTISFDTEQATVLAPEFALTAFAEPQGGDLLAPGSRIVYQFQARMASPFDGIWVTACP